MLCVLLGQITRCCANLFQDFPFSLASICTLSFNSKLNAGSILKVKVVLPSWLLSTNGLIQIVMRLANGKLHRCYYTCDLMIFYE